MDRSISAQPDRSYLRRIVLTLLILFPISRGEGRLPAKEAENGKNVAAKAEKEKLQTQVRELQTRAYALEEKGDFAGALSCARRLVAISERLPGNPEFRAEMLDYLQFLLMKTKAYPEALQAALSLESLAQPTSNRSSPWNCLKIAEACLGLRDPDRALEWIEKAVYERGFIRLEVFRDPVYAPVRSRSRFQKAVAFMEKRIGIGLPARDFSLTLLDGTRFTLSGQRGKVVLLDFWDVKCPPCRREMPVLAGLHRESASRGLVIVGISLDTDRALLLGYLKETSPAWKMACSYRGWDDPAARLYSINATPSSWLIDRKGILRHVNLRGDELIRAVRALL